MRAQENSGSALKPISCCCICQDRRKSDCIARIFAEVYLIASLPITGWAWSLFLKGRVVTLEIGAALYNVAQLRRWSVRGVKVIPCQVRSGRNLFELGAAGNCVSLVIAVSN